MESGTCTVCGHRGEFTDSGHRSIRENFSCPRCRATLRYRHQAAILVQLFSSSGSKSLEQLVAEPEFRGVHVYEPGLIGPFCPRSAATRVRAVGPLDGVELGDEHDGVRCEDLERLTFASARFDLVITSDIFEHVRRPFDAFAEVGRVLKSGGFHVFTVPFSWPLKKEIVARVDTTGERDVHLLPARYHGSPTDPDGSLVYTDFGTSLIDRLDELGFEARLHRGETYNLTVSAKWR